MKAQKDQLLGALALVLWAPIPWLYLDPPGILAGQPLAVYAVILFFGGLCTSAAALLRSLRTRLSKREARAYVFLFVLAFVGAYQFSGLAPGWQCFGKNLEAVVGRAAGQNCKTTCTDNDEKPCSGWSTCWNKFVSCSSTGKDQDGRDCDGCCFSCEVICEEPSTPEYQPPTVNGTIACSQSGSNGWCIGMATLNLSASDPQGFALTISGAINGSAFTCAAGSSCSVALVEGSGPITYKATAATSGLSSATGSTSWKRDVTAPTLSALYPVADGVNGWHRVSPMQVSSGGSDSLSGLASAQVSVNGGAWQPSAVLADGTYAVVFRAQDHAGNSSIVSRTIKIDSIPPSLSPVVPSPNGLNDWFISAPVNVSVNGADSGSGLANALLSVDGSTWQPAISLDDGVYTIDFKSTDHAGNMATATRTVKVDASVPSIVTSTTGSEGRAGWYVSQTTTSISADDLSGIARTEYNQNHTGWQDGTSFVSVEGVNEIDIRIHDLAGNVARQTLEIKIDTTPPVISTSTSGEEGLDGWYVSQTKTDIATHDQISGVDRIQYHQNGSGWQDELSVVSDDGINTIDVRATDIAGNTSSASLEVKIDTIAPTLIPIMPSPDGLDNWFVSAPVSISMNGADAGSGLASAELSVDGSDWRSDASLTDGVHIVRFRALDHAGNSTATSRAVMVDTAAPTLSTSVAGTKGNLDWYVSQTTTAISAFDEGSGVVHIEYNQNNAGWKDGTSVLSKDGINEITLHAYDRAGNTVSDSIRIKVDTEEPASVFSSPLNGSTNTLVRGSHKLLGSSSDAVSGVSSAEISIDGKTWLPVEISSSGVWEYSWNTSGWMDGEYPVVVRTTDMAGNIEAAESGAQATLLVNNRPPHISLTPEWFIWQSGSLVIKTEYFPLREGIIEIADRDGRWPSVKISFGETYPGEIKWNRRFPEGILAPSGDYRVTVSACNIHDLCSKKNATIKIPWIAKLIPTEPAATQTIDVEHPQINEPAPTPAPPVVENSYTESEAQVRSRWGSPSARSILSFLVLIALMWALSSAAVSDRRPVAIRAITETITLQEQHRRKQI